jgi:hypothetical protein
LYGEVSRDYFECIRDGLSNLASDPTNLSRRSNETRPGTKIHEFDCKHGDHGFVFRVAFFFEPGETHINVFDVTVVASWYSWRAAPPLATAVHRSSGVNPVRLAIRASIRGPISSPS